MGHIEIVHAEIYRIEPVDARFIRIGGSPDSRLNAGQRHPRLYDRGARGVQNRARHSASARLTERTYGQDCN